MSDSDKVAHRFSVSISDFVSYLEAKTPDSSCPACNTKVWTVVGSVSNGMAYRMVTDLRDGPSPTHISTVAIYCNECGYIRHHWSKKVREWVDQRSQQTELEFEEASEDDAE